jgi:hypothetical protein
LQHNYVSVDPEQQERMWNDLAGECIENVNEELEHKITQFYEGDVANDIKQLEVRQARDGSSIFVSTFYSDRSIFRAYYSMAFSAAGTFDLMGILVGTPEMKCSTSNFSVYKFFK